MQIIFFEQLIESVPTGIIILDLDENVQSMNPVSKSILGVEEVQQIKLTMYDNKIFRSLETIEQGISQTIKINGLKSY